MVPERDDPRWRELVTGKRSVAFTALATRIIFTRLKLMGSRRDETSIAQAVALAHDYFTKNQISAAEDLRRAFA